MLRQDTCDFDTTHWTHVNHYKKMVSRQMWWKGIILRLIIWLLELEFKHIERHHKIIIAYFRVGPARPSVRFPRLSRGELVLVLDAAWSNHSWIGRCLIDTWIAALSMHSHRTSRSVFSNVYILGQKKQRNKHDGRRPALVYLWNNFSRDKLLPTSSDTSQRYQNLTTAELIRILKGVNHVDWP